MIDKRKLMMNPIKMLLLNEIFASKKVASLFSDRSVNFVLEQGQSELTVLQKKYLSQQLGFSISKIINIRQVHGDHVLIATAQDLQNQEATPEADGIVTNIPGVPIAVRTADCLP